MRRREFITLLGGAAAWPLAARGQQDGRLRRIGALIGGAQGDAEREVNVTAFQNALAGLSWIEGRNLSIDWRWAASDAGRARIYAAELVSLTPDVIFGDNTYVVRALQQATRTIPIVFARVTDAITPGFVNGLAHPDGNITGFADNEESSVGKLAELMREVAPEVTRVAIIFNQQVQRERFRQTLERTTSQVGLKPAFFEVQDARDIEEAIATFATEPNGGLIIGGGAVVLLHRETLIKVAARYRLPAIYRLSIFVQDGGLMSYGPVLIDQYRGAADYVDRILRGAKPGDLPVQLPIKYRLVVNMKTAKELSRDIPLSILMRIDEVIE
jgi:putative ABC transport system substrate-binding protein